MSTNSMEPKVTCAYPPCDRAVISKGLCAGHYKQMRRGEALRKLRVKIHYPSLEDAFILRINFSDDCWNWTGPTDKFGHGALQHGSYKGKTHRYSYETYVGPIGEGLEVDHQCRNPRCIRPSHLLAVTHAENLQNVGASKNNTSGYRGVSEFGGGKWRAYATHKGKQYSGGLFDSAEEANEAAIELRNRLYTNNVSDRGKIMRSGREIEDRIGFLIDSGRVLRDEKDRVITYSLNGN